MVDERQVSQQEGERVCSELILALNRSMSRKLVIFLIVAR